MTNKFILLPIEPLEERYSSQWLNWFEEFFIEKNLDYKIINPKQLTDKIETGQFLDCYNTNYYKSLQLSKVIKMLRDKKIKNTDTIFLMDGWFPGIEMLFYIRDVSRINFKIAAILHAGTWDENDYLSQKGLTYWAKDAESSWLKNYDVIFVATDYHRNLILSKFPHIEKLENKIKVTGLPMKQSDVIVGNFEKKPIVVFPHRLAIEKQPHLFDKLAQDFKKIYPEVNVSFVKSKNVCSSKKEYYELLNESMVSISFAKQETFGIAMCESVYNGCIPLVPNSLAYSELYLSDFKYYPVILSLSNIIYRIYDIITNYKKYEDDLKKQKEFLSIKTDNSLTLMLNSILNL